MDPAIFSDIFVIIRNFDYLSDYAPPHYIKFIGVELLSLILKVFYLEK